MKSKAKMKDDLYEVVKTGLAKKSTGKASSVKKPVYKAKRTA